MTVVACVGYEAGRRVADLDVERCAEFVDRAGRFVWVGLFEPDAATLESLRRQFDLHPLAIEDALEAHQRPKLDVFATSLFMVLRTAKLSDNQEVAYGETHVFAGGGYVITVRHGASQPYGGVRERCEREPELLAHGEDYVLYAVMDFVVDCYLEIVEAMEREIEAIEDDARSGVAGKPMIDRISGLRRSLVRLRRVAAPLLDVCNALQRIPMPFIDDAVKPYYKDVRDHVLRVNESIDILRELLSTAFETCLLLASNRQNEVARQLAGWAAILAVPTAVAGVYGMNFEHMPELRMVWAYPVVLIAIVVVCAALYLRFRRMGWL